jgi:aminoglycoside 6'-N-acetyltransferase
MRDAAPRVGPVTAASGSAGVVALRPMTDDDLALVRRWMGEPHVARWYVAGSTVEAELDDVRDSVRGEQPVEMLIAEEDGRPVGWCQWYRCDDDPDWAADVGADAGDAGIDYAIGDRRAVGRGLGTAMVRLLVAHVRRQLPQAALYADPEATNTASRRVLEKNGFTVVAEGALPSESTQDPIAVYRLAPGGA